MELLGVPLYRRLGKSKRLCRVMLKLGFQPTRVFGLNERGYKEQIRGYCRLVETKNARHLSAMVAIDEQQLEDINLPINLMLQMMAGRGISRRKRCKGSRSCTRHTCRFISLTCASEKIAGLIPLALGRHRGHPDHSVFSGAHERFRENGTLRRVFDGVVAIAAGLAKRFRGDASLVKADVNKSRPKML